MSVCPAPTSSTRLGARTRSLPERLRPLPFPRVLDTTLYIACLVLSDRPCLVVGGGSVGLEKVEGLLACDAAVTLVSPEVVPELEEYAREGSISWERREFRDSDLEAMFLVVA